MLIQFTMAVGPGQSRRRGGDTNRDKTLYDAVRTQEGWCQCSTPSEEEVVEDSLAATGHSLRGVRGNNAKHIQTKQARERNRKNPQFFLFPPSMYNLSMFSAGNSSLSRENIHCSWWTYPDKSKTYSASSADISPLPEFERIPRTTRRQARFSCAL